MKQHISLNTLEPDGNRYRFFFAWMKQEDPMVEGPDIHFKGFNDKLEMLKYAADNRLMLRGPHTYLIVNCEDGTVERGIYDTHSEMERLRKEKEKIEVARQLEELKKKAKELGLDEEPKEKSESEKASEVSQEDRERIEEEMKKAEDTGEHGTVKIKLSVNPDNVIDPKDKSYDNPSDIHTPSSSAAYSEPPDGGRGVAPGHDDQPPRPEKKGWQESPGGTTCIPGK